MLEALEALNSKTPIKFVVNTSMIEEKLDNIWEILYDTKNGIKSWTSVLLPPTSFIILLVI